MVDEVELIEQVRETMLNTFGVDEDDLPPEVSQENYSRWTSLSHMTLMAALEEQFQQTFSMEEMLAMTSQPKIVRVLKQRLVGSPG